jgi:hypothetical protein
MNLSQLSSLGETVGIGGVALGVAAAILARLVARSTGLRAADRARLFNIIAIGCFALGGLGLLVGFTQRPAPEAAAPPPQKVTHGDQSPIIEAGGKVTIQYLGKPPPPSQ